MRRRGQSFDARSTGTIAAYKRTETLFTSLICRPFIAAQGLGSARGRTRAQSIHDEIHKSRQAWLPVALGLDLPNACNSQKQVIRGYA